MKSKSETNNINPETTGKPLSGEIVQPGEPVPPPALDETETTGLKTQASQLVAELEASAGSREMILTDNLSALGLHAQREAAGKLDLLKARMGEMMVRKDTGAEISKDLIGLRLALNEINPHELSQPDIFRRLFGGLPFINKLPSPAKVLEMIAVRYENVSQQVQVIEVRLGEGRRMLARDNVELRMFYEQVEAQMLPLQRQAYLGELIMQELDLSLANIQDPVKGERLRMVLHDVAMRVQDLRTMEQVFYQFFTSIDLTRQNNTRLGQTVERTLSLATNVVTVGMAIQTAMARQKRVLEATQKTQLFLGEMIAANATAIKQQTQEIGDIYNNPVIALDKVIAAHDQLVEALNLVDQMHATGIENARQNIAQLTALSAELHKRALTVGPSANEPEAGLLSEETSSADE